MQRNLGYQRKACAAQSYGQFSTPVFQLRRKVKVGTDKNRIQT